MATLQGGRAQEAEQCQWCDHGSQNRSAWDRIDAEFLDHSRCVADSAGKTP
jgi:hypothetical protein